MQPQGPPPSYPQQTQPPPYPPAPAPYAPAPPTGGHYTGQPQPPVQPTVTNNNTTTSNNNNNNNIINNTVVVGQPGATENSLLLIPKDKIYSRDWTTGMCGCLNDFTSCICGCICLPGLIARVSNRLGECCLLCCIPGAAMAMRAKLRTLGGIRGSIWCDCVMTTLCLPCAMCQLSREMDAMGL